VLELRICSCASGQSRMEQQRTQESNQQARFSGAGSSQPSPRLPKLGALPPVGISQAGHAPEAAFPLHARLVRFAASTRYYGFSTPRRRGPGYAADAPGMLRQVAGARLQEQLCTGGHARSVLAKDHPGRPDLPR
jgi:hypothetical protein